jgi:hypothetical protein
MDKKNQQELCSPISKQALDLLMYIEQHLYAILKKSGVLSTCSPHHRTQIPELLGSKNLGALAIT